MAPSKGAARPASSSKKCARFRGGAKRRTSASAASAGLPVHRRNLGAQADVTPHPILPSATFPSKAGEGVRALRSSSSYRRADHATFQLPTPLRGAFPLPQLAGEGGGRRPTDGVWSAACQGRRLGAPRRVRRQGRKCFLQAFTALPRARTRSGGRFCTVRAVRPRNL